MKLNIPENQKAELNENADISESSEITQGLADTAQTIGTSLRNMQEVLVENMQQAMQMTLSMNAMMEELVKRSMQISVLAQHTSRDSESHSIQGCDSARGKSQTVLNIKVKNRSPIPLLNMVVKLWFATITNGTKLVSPVSVSILQHQTDKNQDVEIKFTNAKADVTGSGISEGAGPFVRSDSVVLPSGKTAVAEIRVVLDKPCQLNGRVDVEFISPGTGASLVNSGRFGIRLIHQLKCSFDRDSTKEWQVIPDTPQIAVGIRSLRSTFNLSPISGISPGSVFTIKLDKRVDLGLRVDEISENGESGMCTWLCTEKYNAGDDTLSFLAKELTLKPL